MTLETAAVKATVDTTRTAVKTAETAIKKAWSILDAATEKKTPSESLSPQGIKAIQGNGG